MEGKEKEYLITFCWAMKVPAEIRLYGNPYFLIHRQISVKAKDSKDALQKLHGTRHDVLSSINDIICLQ